MSVWKTTGFFLLIIACCAVHAAALTTSPPFIIKLISKPSALVAGEKHTFTVEIKNNSGAPLTLSSLYAFSSRVYWSNPDGSGQGTFSGGGSKMIIGTDINPETGEIACKYFHYEKGDFITIPSHGSKRFDIVVDVSKACEAAEANVTIDFESKYDGSEVGIRAWTGKAKSINLPLHVRQPAIL